MARTITVILVVTAVGAVFTVANATMLRPLPFPESDRLVRVYSQPPNTTTFDAGIPLHPLTFVRLRERAATIEGLEGIWSSPRAVVGDGEPESVDAARVSAAAIARSRAGP